MTAEEGIEREKERMRRDLHLVLSTIGPDESERAANRLAEHVAETPEFASAKVIGLYASTKNELSTGPLFDLAISAGKCCVFPRCLEEDLLEFARVESPSDLVPGRYGILEPARARETVELAEIDLVIVPGLGFDRSGGRLGRGGGYYDRTFSGSLRSRPFLLGVAHSVQVFEVVPVAEHDQRMDAIVTEAGMTRVR